MPHRQSGAQLEQRLTVPVMQFVENRPSRRGGERVEHLVHCFMIGKSLLACQSTAATLEEVVGLRRRACDAGVPHLLAGPTRARARKGLGKGWWTAVAGRRAERSSVFGGLCRIFGGLRSAAGGDPAQAWPFGVLLGPQSTTLPAPARTAVEESSIGPPPRGRSSPLGQPAERPGRAPSQCVRPSMSSR
jgi:hypothetical protein